MTRLADGAMLHALTRLHGLALRRPVHREDTLAERLARADVTPKSIVAQVRRYAMEARRAGRLPEAMVIQLKDLYVSVRLRLDPSLRRSTRMPAADPLLTFIISHAIDAYFADGDADA